MMPTFARTVFLVLFLSLTTFTFTEGVTFTVTGTGTANFTGQSLYSIIFPCNNKLTYLQVFSSFLQGQAIFFTVDEKKEKRKIVRFLSPGYL